MNNKNLIALSLFFFLLLLLTYSNHFDNGFYFDDSHTIETNGYVRDIKNIPQFFTSGIYSSSLPTNQAYRPIVAILNTVDYQIAGGLHPFYYHLSIFFWYVVQLALLFFVFIKIFNISFKHQWNSLFALFATAFYALHTANAETINYISARSDSFSTLCIVAAFLLYQNAKTRKYYIYLMAMLIGIYTKQTAAMFAPLLFLYILFFEEKISWNNFFKAENGRRLVITFKKSAPAIILATIIFILNQYYFTPETVVSSNKGVSRIDYFTTQFFISTHYIGNFILPVNLSADHDFEIITSFFDKRILFGFFVILILLTFVFLSFKQIKTRPIAFGILWFFIALLPSSSLVPLFQISNDHRTFFPYIGLVLSVSWAIGLVIIKYQERLQNKPLLKRIIPVSMIFIISLYAFGTYKRNVVWSSKERLWYDVTLKSPDNYRGWMNYGLSQMQKGEYDVALEYFNKVYDKLPNHSYLNIYLAILKDKMGNAQEAEKYFKNAFKYGWGSPEPYYYYAKWLYENKRTEEAKYLLQKGLQISPEHTEMKKLVWLINK